MKKIDYQYAKTLFNLFLHSETFSQVAFQIKNLFLPMSLDKGFICLLSSPKLTYSKKEEILRKILIGFDDGKLLNFFLFLLKKKRISNLSGILERFIDLYNIHKGVKFAKLISTSKLAVSILDGLKKVIKNNYGFEQILFDEVIDKNLENGFIVYLEGRRLDCSLIGILNNIKNNLSKS